MGSYNTGICAARKREESNVAHFEQIGKRIDKELDKLRVFLQKELKPTTGRKTAAALRQAALRLNKAANEIEGRLAKGKK
jgi:hypothetical protein